MWSAVGRVFRDDCRTRAAPVCCNLGLGDFMTAPLDPVIAQIIPLLPLRDPETMTPQSARDALRALAAARAAVPPPPVMSATDAKVKGAAGFLGARIYRVSGQTSPTVVFFH